MRLVYALSLLISGSAYAQTGGLDPTFGAGGRVVLDPSGTLQSAASSVAVLPDGRVLLAGSVGSDAAVLRLTAAGALDPTYGVGGVRRVSAGPDVAAFTSLVLLADGSAVAAGLSQDADDTPTGALVVRLTPAGALDAAFGTGGVVREAVAEASAFLSLAVQPDGRVVAAGQVEDSGDSRFVAVRYLRTGARDASFGTGGRSAPAALVASGDALALDAAGRLVAVGIVGGPGGFFDTQIVTSRLLASGALDASFGNGGSVVADFGPSFDIATDVVVDAAGRATVGGGVLDFATDRADLLLLRYTAAGAPDASFGAAGVVRTSAFGPAAIAFSLALQADGRLLVGGTAGTFDSGDFLLARYTDAGRLDPAFGTGGRTVVDVGDNDVAFALALGSDGRAVLAGQTGDVDGTTTSIAVARLVTDGRPTAAEAPTEAPAGALVAAPNPFAGSSAVTLVRAEAGPVHVAVYDALGRRVAVLHDGALGAGNQTFRLDGAALAPGVYVVRADGASSRATVRVVRR